MINTLRRLGIIDDALFPREKICNNDIINLRVLNKNQGVDNLKEECVVRYSSRPLEKPKAPTSIHFPALYCIVYCK